MCHLTVNKHHTCDRQLSALNMSKNTKQVKVIVVSLGVIILSLIWNKKMITNVQPTELQQTKTQQFVSKHGVTSLKNSAVKKTNAWWYKWHLLSLMEGNQFCTKQTHNNMWDLWLPQQCCWRIKSSGMLWCVAGLQFLAFQRIIVPSTSGSGSPRNEAVSDLAVHIYRQGHWSGWKSYEGVWSVAWGQGALAAGSVGRLSFIWGSHGHINFWSGEIHCNIVQFVRHAVYSSRLLEYL